MEDVDTQGEVGCDELQIHVPPLCDTTASFALSSHILFSAKMVHFPYVKKSFCEPSSVEDECWRDTVDAPWR
jgi:hypothetical protein